MVLHYCFEDIECEVLASASEHIGNGWFEPHYRTESCEVDYDYEVEPSLDDFLDYMEPFQYLKWGKAERDAYDKAISDVWNSSWFDIESLEEDDGFIEFMRERYEDEAREECQNEYGD